MKRVGALAKSIVALLALAAIVWMVDVQSLYRALASISVTSLIWLAGISFLLIFVSVLKWRLFLLESGQKVGLWHLFGLYLVGYFVNLLMPSYFGGDAVRSFYLGKRTGQHEVAAATILERVTGLVAMVVLALLFMWASDLVSIWARLSVAAMAGGLGLLIFVALHPRWVRWFERHTFTRPVMPHLFKVQAALNLAARSPRLLAGAFALSFLFHVLTVLNVVISAWAVGWASPPLWDLFVVLPIILFIAALPVSPQGLGVQEFGFVFFLQQIGATDGQALGIAIVLRAKQCLLAFFGWWYWWRLKQAKYEASYVPDSMA